MFLGCGGGGHGDGAGGDGDELDGWQLGGGEGDVEGGCWGAVGRWGDHSRFFARLKNKK